ncbi:MAG: hypothetical protein Q9207_006748 [Kuettlingeria erythrocarpa]
MSSSSPAALIAPKHPIAIRLDFVAIERTTILIQQKAGWTYGDFVARKADGTTILTSSGKLLSNSARKDFQDASGLPLFSLRKAWLSITRHFWLELPGGEDIVTVQQKWSFGNTKINFTFRNAASDQEDVVLKLRGDDMRNTLSHISYIGNKVALIRRKNDQSHPMSYKFLPEYEVDVAEGIDVALISVIVITMAGLIQNHWDTKHPRQ